MATHTQSVLKGVSTPLWNRPTSDLNWSYGERPFLGWSTDPSATAATYTDGGSYSFTSDTSLYAVWGADPTIDVKQTTSATYKHPSAEKSHVYAQITLPCAAEVVVRNHRTQGSPPINGVMINAEEIYRNGSPNSINLGYLVKGTAIAVIFNYETASGLGPEYNCKGYFDITPKESGYTGPSSLQLRYIRLAGSWDQQNRLHQDVFASDYAIGTLYGTISSIWGKLNNVHSEWNDTWCAWFEVDGTSEGSGKPIARLTYRSTPDGNLPYPMRSST